MQYEITEEREKYLLTNSRIILNACPGSGKTTSIAKKIDLISQNWISLYGKYSGIACLSFTNAAKDELQKKIYEVNSYYLQFPHIISTIDSFINRFITLPFYNVIFPNRSRPKIVDSDDIISNALKTRYFKNGEMHEGIEYPLGLYKDNANKSLFHKYEPKDIWIEKDGRFSYLGKRPSSALVQDSVFQQYGAAIFEKKISKGLITSLDSSFIAYKVLTKHSRIGEYLIKRFPYIIIDEAQDNSEIQHAIFDKLVQIGLRNIELIGDPYQSLYEWRHAKPHLFIQKYHNSDWIGLPLSDNRRSNQRIIDCYSILRLNTDPKIISKNVTDLNIPIVFYKYDDSNKEKIIIDFEKRCKQHNLSECQIVVRGNVLKDRMLGNNVPVLPWHSDVPYILIKSVISSLKQDIKRPIKELRRLSVQLMFPELNHKERKIKEDEYSTDIIFNSLLYNLLRSVPPLSYSFERWTSECQMLLKTHLNLAYEPDFQFKGRMVGFKMKELKSESIHKYFNRNFTTVNRIPITTIHQAKGKTFDALLYFFNENSIGQNVSFNDFIPATIFPSEKQRMIYVACSRPRQFLALSFPKKITERSIINRFGTNIEISDI